MTSNHRSIAGRTGVIGVVATLFLVGLVTPAFALPPSPVITSFLPVSGPVGTSVTITGTDLGSATVLTFNGVSALPATSNNATTIVAVVPATATTGKISVTTAGGSNTTAANFTVMPAVTSFAPVSGSIGTSVTITGTTLSSATSVKFNGVSATTTSGNTATQIVAVVPPGATTGKVSVTTADGTGTSAANFTIIPGITSFSPSSGLEGATVTITGTDLLSATSVKFNGVSAAMPLASDTATQIIAVVPTGATTGKISVTTAAGTGTSLANFTVLAGITSFGPNKGAIGASVTITGTTLSGATFVRFNGLAAVISSNTATQIVAVVPVGATTGKISVTTAAGTATSLTNFTVTHARSVSLQLKGHLTALGTLRITDGTAACASHARVKIQRHVHGHWRTVKTKTTSGSGTFKTSLANDPGKYRALATKDTLASGDICVAATSQVKTHR